MFCTKCGSAIGSSESFCTDCGSQLPRHGSSRATTILKWGGLGCGVLIGLLVVVLVLSWIGSSIGTTDDGGMEAAVKVYPGGLEWTNLNDFPWYGLVITLDDRYSNRYLFGDPDRPYLRHDKAVGPDEVQTMDFDNFIDADGIRWQIVPYQVTVKRVRLEAKSRVNGPYDLSATFDVDGS